jgi:hypothetical protein
VLQAHVAANRISATGISSLIGLNLTAAARPASAGFGVSRVLCSAVLGKDAANRMWQKGTRHPTRASARCADQDEAFTNGRLSGERCSRQYAALPGTDPSDFKRVRRFLPVAVSASISGCRGGCASMWGITPLRRRRAPDCPWNSRIISGLWPAPCHRRNELTPPPSDCRETARSESLPQTTSPGVPPTVRRWAPSQLERHRRLPTRSRSRRCHPKLRTERTHRTGRNGGRRSCLSSFSYHPEP